MNGFFEWIGRSLFELFENVGQFAFLVRSSVQWAVRAKIEWRVASSSP